ncbi:MAG: NifB/NifX family molybdenum-iron cluster-binding protein [Polyangia bacterium]
MKKNSSGKQVAVAAADDGGLEAAVSMHFGRCPFYVVIELAGEEVAGVESVANPSSGEHSPGRMPQVVAGLGAEVIISGGMGPRALDAFERLGIEAVTGASGKVGDALDAYLRGDLQGVAPCDPARRGAHHGARGTGPGRRGGGGGLWGGRGGAMGGLGEPEH